MFCFFLPFVVFFSFCTTCQMLWCGDRLPYWLNIYNANFLLLYQLEFNVINFLQLLLTILSTIQEHIDIFPFSQTLHILTTMLKCKSTCTWRSFYHDTIDWNFFFSIYHIMCLIKRISKYIPTPWYMHQSFPWMQLIFHNSYVRCYYHTVSTPLMVDY